jgi:hypothetical protein
VAALHESVTAGATGYLAALVDDRGDELWGMTREADTYEMASTWMEGSDPNLLRIVFHSSNVGTGFAISRWQDDERTARPQRWNRRG